MNMKPATTLVGVAIIAALGFAAYQLWAGNRIGAPPEPQFVTASRASRDRDECRPGSAGNEPRRHLHRGQRRPPAADHLRDRPGRIAVHGPARLRGGPLTEFSDADQQVILSWAALYRRRQMQERARALYAEELQSEAGSGRGRRQLGDVEPTSSDDVDPQDDAKVYLWQRAALVLAAATIGDYDPDQMRLVDEGMDKRAADATEVAGAGRTGRPPPTIALGLAALLVKQVVDLVLPGSWTTRIFVFRVGVSSSLLGEGRAASSAVRRGRS